MDKTDLYSNVICIGGGVSGICVAAQLQTQLGEKDVHIYERNNAPAGTWYENKYPGCACDVPGHFYSFSFHLNPTWTRAFSPAPEIRAYLGGVVGKYDIARRTTLSTEVTAATYDEAAQQWVVHLRDLRDGRTYTHRCKVLVSGVGALSAPNTPQIPGADAFEGEAWHTARYRTDVDIRGKHVVVIGNGCTAAQLIPTILPSVASLTQIGRSPHWLLPPTDFLYPDFVKTLFAWVPGLMRLHRTHLWWLMESSEPMMRFTDKGKQIRKRFEKASRDYITQEAPQKYWKILTPTFEVGCKRRVFDNLHYVPALHAPNMHLTASNIARINAKSITTEDGKEYPADVIIYATGFHASHTLDAIAITGRGGRTLKEHWSPATPDGFDGPEAYNTTAMHGFPNFFLVFGPNSATGYTSVILAVENTVNFVIKMSKAVLHGDASAVEVKADAERRYAALTQATLKERVYATCTNWYVEKSGWNAAVYPWDQIHFWRRCAFPTWSDWDVTYTKPVWARRTARRLARSAALLLVLALGARAAGVSTDPKRAMGWVVAFVGELQRRALLLGRSA